eukprot:1160109-Pelagomonas_calceolata.AAC.3
MQRTNPNFQDRNSLLCVIGEVERAVCGLASQGVNAWKGRSAWASASQFLPNNSDATHFFIAPSMQIGGQLNKEQIGTLTVRVGELGRGFGGEGGESEGTSAKITCASQKKKMYTLLARTPFLLDRGSFGTEAPFYPTQSNQALRLFSEPLRPS